MRDRPRLRPHRRLAAPPSSASPRSSAASSPPAAASSACPRRCPPKIALELALTGDPISAQRAYDLGLVNELCEAGQAVDAAVALAERICANAPLAVRESRKVVLKALGTADEEELWNASNAAFAKVAQSEDFAEGPLAFIEKRAPQWKGR